MTTRPPGPDRARWTNPSTTRAGHGPGRGTQKRRSRWRTARRVLLSLVALGIIGPIVAFLLAYVAVDVPRPSDIQTDQVATIFYADGVTPLSTVVPEEGNRTDVGIDEVPAHVRNAVLSAEDRSFYSNPGFSVSGILRAAVNNVGGGDPQGASTITQQYVKNALVGNDQTLTRKMRELVVSTKMARQSSKDDILAAYLNTIYFGRGAYGVSAAAGAYFGKPVTELTVAEGAVLAASIRSPSALDPETDPVAAQERWNYVLDGMASEGLLPQAERNAQVYPSVIPLAEVSNGSNLEGPEGLVVRQVRQELADSGISEQQLNTEGLQITTTIDPRAQQAAVGTVDEVLGDQPPELRSAVVSVDPRTGAVRAYYGGRYGNGFDYALAKRSGGSSMKVFTTAAALAQGIPLSARYDSSSPQEIAGTEVSNSEGASCGTCSIAEALKRSLNTVFFQLAVDVGPQAVADMAYAAGIPVTFPDGTPSLVDPDGQIVAGLTLGVGSVRPVDMATAYGTFANNGTHLDRYFVQQVVTADGEVLLDRGTPTGEQVIEETVARNVTAAMEPIAEFSRDHGLADGRPSAAKTGTNQSNDTDNNADAWMVGYTPSLSTAVWIGNDDQSDPIFTAEGNDIFGSGLPSDIWQEVMNAALEGTPQEEFPEAPPIEGQEQGGVPQEQTEEPEQAPLQEQPQQSRQEQSEQDGEGLPEEGQAEQEEPTRTPEPESEATEATEATEAPATPPTEASEPPTTQAPTPLSTTEAPAPPTTTADSGAGGSSGEDGPGGGEQGGGDEQGGAGSADDRPGA